MDPQISAKVEHYEKFVDEKFRADLQTVLKDQEQIYADIAEYLQIKEAILKIQQTKTTNDSKTPLRTKVDLGCNFYANALVEDTSRIFVAIGYGFFLEMKLDEALRFIEKKVKELNGQALMLNETASEIKAKIRFVLEGLKELQTIEFNPENQKDNRNSLFI